MGFRVRLQGLLNGYQQGYWKCSSLSGPSSRNFPVRGLHQYKVPVAKNSHVGTRATRVGTKRPNTQSKGRRV